MALTPRGIFSPDSTDGYDVTVDWAATADSIESALDQASNYGVGTTSERTAALAGLPNGAKWYDTTLSAEYRKIAGVWDTVTPFAQAAGFFWGGAGPTSITFPAGRFTVTPIIIPATLEAVGVVITARSETGFTYNTADGSNKTLMWTALQMTPTSAGE